MGRISLIGLGTGPLTGKLIDALAEAIVEVELEALGELAAKPRVQGVEIGVHIAGGDVYGKESWIRLLQEILVDQSNQLVARAALIAYGCDQIPAQAAFRFQRVEIHVGIAELRCAAIDFDGLIRCAGGVSADATVLRINSECKRRIHRIAGGRIAGAEGVEDGAAVKWRAVRTAAKVETSKR